MNKTGKKAQGMVILFTAVLAAAAALVLVVPWGYVKLRSAGSIYRQGESIPPAPVAIVFGAGLWRSGVPTPVLADRVATAVDLYKAGRVSKLLLSGDNRSPNHNEPGAMRQLALQLGVPSEDLVLDYAGRRSYDTCYRARYVFEVTQAILVSQAYHLPRALYSCHALGVQAVGVAADRRRYSPLSYLYWQLREFPATLVALLDAHLQHSQPILGPVQPLAGPQSSESRTE